MFDEMTMLRESQPLQCLLAHYAAADQAAPEAWQPRLPELAEVEPEQLIKLHGHLLAHGWLAINIQGQEGGYRVTQAGTRALRRAQAPAGDEEETPIIEMEQPAWKTRRRKKEAA